MKNKITQTLKAVTFSLIFCLSSASAALIDFGTHVGDFSTGYSWLKLTHYTGLSYNDSGILSLNQGYRYATKNEVGDLIKQFIPNTNDWDIPNHHAIAAPAQSFINLFGATYDGPPGDNWFDYTWGYTQDSAGGGEQYTPYIGWDDELNSYGEVGFNSLNSYKFHTGGHETLGHWLVRTTAIPEPSTYALLTLGLLGLGLYHKKRTK